MPNSRKIVPIMNYKEVNEMNIDIYDQFKDFASNELRHKCVLCGRNVSINGSFSNQGDNLVCTFCFKEKFTNISELFDWMMDYPYIENGRTET